MNRAHRGGRVEVLDHQLASVDPPGGQPNGPTHAGARDAIGRTS